MSTKNRTLLLVSEFGTEIGQYCYADSFYKILSELGFDNGVVIRKFDCKTVILSRFLKSYVWINYFLRLIDDFFINIYLLILAKYFVCPDTVFFIKAENINYRLIRYFKQKMGNQILIFYPDSPFSFFNGNSGNNVLMSLPYYDIFFVWSKVFTAALKSGGSNNVSFFPFYPDHEMFGVGSLAQGCKKYDVCFVGAWDNKREEYLDYLVETCPLINLGLAGGMWDDKLSSSSKLRPFLIGDSLTFSGMTSLFRDSHVSVNILKQQNTDSHNMRTFEIPAAGCFMLAEYSREQSEFFGQNKEADYFINKKELSEKLKLYLLDIAHLKLMATSGYKKSMSYSLKLLLKEKIPCFDQKSNL